MIESITTIRPIKAELFVEDYDPYVPRAEVPGYFGTILLEPGTYAVESIEPPVRASAFGTVIVDLGDGSFAQIDYDTLTEQFLLEDAQ